MARRAQRSAAAVPVPEAEPLAEDATLKLTPDERGKTLVRRAIDPNNPEFLTRALGTISHARLESAHRYLMTLHKVSDMLSRAASVETLFDAVLRAVLDAISG